MGGIRLTSMVTLVAFLASVVRFGFVCGAEPQHDDGAQRLFHRFLDRLKLDAPVAGEFEIKRTPAKGLGRGMPQLDRLLRCRWAWERDREMLEALPESNVFEHFVSTRGAILEGMGPLNYNLSAPKHASALGPSSFYFLVGAAPWFELADAPVRFGASDAATPPGTKVVRVKIRDGEVKVFLRESDARHLGHDTFWEGRIFHRLRITKLMGFTDGRTFPSSAKLESFLTKREEVTLTDELRTVHLQFPRGQVQVETAFATEIPKGSAVHDLERKTHVTLTSATPASVLSDAKLRKDRAPSAR